MTKTVECYDLRNNLVKKYPSIQQAVEEVKLSRTALLKAVKNKKTCKGYRWRYAPVTKIDKPIDSRDDISKYTNPHTAEERREYRERCLKIANHISNNGCVVDEVVREWHQWEREYSEGE